MGARAEQVDVVIVGSRCAGSATAIPLAARGRSVIALDRAAFPSDTLSTHLFFPHHWAELERLGVRERVEALGAPPHLEAGLGAAGVEVVGPFRPYEGIAVGGCVRRPGLDQALVDRAREVGAEVRERTRVTGLLRDPDGRVAGVRWSGRDGREGEIRARLVVGADGRHSTVARLVGAPTHHEWENRRLMAFAYYDDPRTADRSVAMQWRHGDELVTVFPCDGDRSVVLLMSPVGRADEFRADPTGAYEATVAAVPPLVARLEGCTRATKVRTSYRHPAFFRRSQGPGWALPGDAGHFKDPVTAQGIRDALRFGRLLGEAAAPALDDPAALDRALTAWEEDRDAQCLPMYQWANQLGLADDVSPIEDAAYRWFAARPDGASELLDLFSRRRAPRSVFTLSRLARWTIGAIRIGHPPRAVLATVRRDLGREAGALVERLRFDRRRRAAVPASPSEPAVEEDAAAREAVSA